MLPVLDLRGSALTTATLRNVLPRAAVDVASTLERVKPICDAVRDRGTEALLEFAERFDGVRPASTRVPREVLDKALIDLDPAVRAALEEAARRARVVHTAQKHPDVEVE